MDVFLYTDGSALGNPGRGGSATLLCDANHKVIWSQNIGFRHTTNNRMELMGFLMGLNKLSEYPNTKNVTLFSDSYYIINPFEKNWLTRWIRKDFKKIKNTDLWKKIYMITKKYNIIFQWVKGHSGNFFNEKCDYMASTIAKEGPWKIDSWYEKLTMHKLKLFKNEVSKK